MALSQFVAGQKVSTNGEQLQADQDGLPACMFVFCQTAQTVIFCITEVSNLQGMYGAKF